MLVWLKICTSLISCLKLNVYITVNKRPPNKPDCRSVLNTKNLAKLKIESVCASYNFIFGGAFSLGFLIGPFSFWVFSWHQCSLLWLLDICCFGILSHFYSLRLTLSELKINCNINTTLNTGPLLKILETVSHPPPYLEHFRP